MASVVCVWPFISAKRAEAAATATPMKKNVARSPHFARSTRSAVGAVTSVL